MSFSSTHSWGYRRIKNDKNVTLFNVNGPVEDISRLYSRPGYDMKPVMSEEGQTFPPNLVVSILATPWSVRVLTLFSVGKKVMGKPYAHSDRSDRLKV